MPEISKDAEQLIDVELNRLNIHLKEKEANLLREYVNLLESSDPWASQDPINHYQFDPLKETPGYYYGISDIYARKDGHNPPAFRSETELHQIQEAARYLEQTSAHAIGVLDLLTNFIIGSGYQYSVVPVEPEYKLAADQAQRVVDDFCADNDWDELEQELFRRSRRDGEYFLRLRDDYSGGLVAQVIEPVQVTEPANFGRVEELLGWQRGYTSWSYGVARCHADQRVHGYWVTEEISPSSVRGEFLTDDLFQHVKVNVDRVVKRGISDLFCVQTDFNDVRKLVRNIRISAGIISAIAFIREHSPGTQASSVTQLQSAIKDTTRTNIYGRSENVANYGPGSIIDVKHNQKYHPSPMGASHGPNWQDITDLCLRSIATRWNLTEAAISASSSDSFASAMVSEGKQVKMFERSQAYYRKRFRGVIERVIEHAAVSGRLGSLNVPPEAIGRVLKIIVECPEIASRNKKEYFEINKGLHKAGLLSKRSWAARHDIEYTEEQKQIKSEGSTSVSMSDEEHSSGEVSNNATGPDAEMLREQRYENQVGNSDQTSG